MMLLDDSEACVPRCSLRLSLAPCPERFRRGVEQANDDFCSDGHITQTSTEISPSLKVLIESVGRKPHVQLWKKYRIAASITTYCAGAIVILVF